MKSNEKNQTPEAGKAKLRFTTRLSPKAVADVAQDKSLGIPVVSELEIRLPVAVAAGRTARPEEY